MQFLSPAGVRKGFVSDEDPLSEYDKNGGLKTFGDQYQAAKQKSEELEGFAALFNEMPQFPSPEQAREILSKENYRQIKPIELHGETAERWINHAGVIAVIQGLKSTQAVIYFHLQTLSGVCPYILSGNRSPFTLANGDCVFRYSIHAEPGVLEMLRQVEPYILKPWRIDILEIKGLDVLEDRFTDELIEYRPTIAKGEPAGLKNTMMLSWEVAKYFGDCSGATYSGGATRYWYEIHGKAVSFIGSTPDEVNKWLILYKQLAHYAQEQGCRLTERNSLELQMTGKLCCSKEGQLLKVQMGENGPRDNGLL